MATKKQQDRRAKAKRHGLGRHAYEYVLVDEEGNEIEQEPAEKPAKGTAKRGSSGSGKPQRKVKEPQPPSVERLLKRSIFFVPVILLLTLSQKKVSTDAKILQAVVFAVVFVALMWLSDSLVWRYWQKKKAKEAAARGGKPGAGGKG